MGKKSDFWLRSSELASDARELDFLAARSGRHLRLSSDSSAALSRSRSAPSARRRLAPNQQGRYKDACIRRTGNAPIAYFQF